MFSHDYIKKFFLFKRGKKLSISGVKFSHNTPKRGKKLSISGVKFSHNTPKRGKKLSIRILCSNIYRCFHLSLTVINY